jgi:hypothetical protein
LGEEKILRIYNAIWNRLALKPTNGIVWIIQEMLMLWIIGSAMLVYATVFATDFALEEGL